MLDFRYRPNRVFTQPIPRFGIGENGRDPGIQDPGIANASSHTAA